MCIAEAALTAVQLCSERGVISRTEQAWALRACGGIQWKTACNVFKTNLFFPAGGTNQ